MDNTWIPVDFMYTDDVLQPQGSVAPSAFTGKRSVVIIGTATDGPSMKPILVRSIDEVEDRFGGVYYEKFSAASGTASGSVTVEPDGGIINAYEQLSDGLYDWHLDSLEVSGAAFTFTPLGVAKDLVLSYRPKPTTVISNDLIRGVSEAYAVGGPDIYALRLDGTFAEAAVGDMTVRSSYHGLKYNDVVCTVSGNTLSVAQPAGKGYDRSYTFTDLQSLCRAINKDAALGLVCVTATTESPYATTISSGSYALSGGTNGGFTEANITAAFDILSDLAADVIVPYGAIDEEWYDIIYALIEDLQYPSMVVLTAPAVGERTLQEYVDALIAFESV